MEFNMDDKIKKALEGLDVPFDATHWQQMADRLDKTSLEIEDTTAENSFDKIFNEKADNIGSGLTSDWGDFAKKLEESEVEGDDTIDAVIAAGLLSATAAAPMDWDSFSEKLDIAEAQDLSADDNIIDQKAKGLDNLESPYKEENWDIMSQRIQEEFSLRRKLIRYRVAEISVMLLAIITLVNFLPKTETGKIKLIEEVKERIIKKSQIQDRETVFEKEPIAALNKQKSKKTEKPKEVGILPNFLENEPVTNYVATGKTISVIAPQMINELDPIASVEPIIDQRNTPSLEPSVSIRMKQKEEEKKNWFNLSLKKKKEEDKDVAADELMKSFVLASLGEKLSKELVAEEEKKLNPSKVKLEHTNVRLAMFTALNLYGVYSPYDRFFNYRPDVVYDKDAGGGILLDFQKNRFHIVTGGAYTPKYYQPNIGSEVVGSFETAYVKEDFSEIQLDILHIPLEVRYDFIQKPKWRVYGGTGASFNFVLNTGYRFQSEILAKSEDADARSIADTQQRNSDFARKDFTEGVVEGGTLPENTVLMVQLGFGAERFFTQRWSVFFETNYQSQFSSRGIGPNENSFRSLSLRLGAKATMFGK